MIKKSNQPTYALSIPKDPVRVLGIDPGISGGLVLLKNGVVESSHHMPIYRDDGKAKIHLHELSELIIRLHPEVCILEKTLPMPGLGLQSISTTAINWGMVYTVVHMLKVPIVTVYPVSWTNAVHSIDKATRLMDNPKQKSLLVYKKLYPKSTETHDGLVDATLIAFWWLWTSGTLSRMKSKT